MAGYAINIQSLMGIDGYLVGVLSARVSGLEREERLILSLNDCRLKSMVLNTESFANKLRICTKKLLITVVHIGKLIEKK